MTHHDNEQLHTYYDQVAAEEYPECAGCRRLERVLERVRAGLDELRDILVNACESDDYRITGKALGWLDTIIEEAETE